MEGQELSTGTQQLLVSGDFKLAKFYAFEAA
jgi:hypothetical protein